MSISFLLLVLGLSSVVEPAGGTKASDGIAWGVLEAHKLPHQRKGKDFVFFFMRGVFLNVHRNTSKRCLIDRKPDIKNNLPSKISHSLKINQR